MTRPSAPSPRPLGILFGAALVPLLTASLAAQGVEPEPMPTADYAALTNPKSAATNFNVETVRGMLLTEDGLFALNTHASQIVFHTDLVTPGWEKEFATVHNPVAITRWNERLLVVGGSSWALVEHDYDDGRILRHVELPAEPADIVVDEARDEAYVACQGANAVVRINLLTFRVNARYEIPAERPRFLFFDADAEVPVVYVAPFLSGNNTTINANFVNGGSFTDSRSMVVDLDNVPGSELPDEDLFQIDPTQPPAVAVSAVLHDAGTMLVEHGRNPWTGDYWMVSTESHNALENSEDKHRGEFATAQLAIAATLGGPGRPTPGIYRDLDAPIGGGQKGVNTSMSFPWALAFSDTGFAAIASSTSDLVTIVNPSGLRVFDLPITQTTHSSQPAMPAQIGRAIPRDLIWDDASNTLILYCWGWNKVLVYNVNQPNDPPYWLDLGPDPLPISAQKGRSIWYDAKRPVDIDPDDDLPFPGTVTCNTCHPGGKFDLLAWALSDSFKDVKDLMVTQSLLSISDTFPYHWRGERNLDHFNGAFEGLLGFAGPLDETPGGELDNFQDFVFGLQAQANPNQIVQRQLDGIDARNGQQVFLTKDDVLFNQFSCVECHRFPAGTNGENIAEVPVQLASAGTLDVAHMRQMTHKDQTPVEVDVPRGDVNNPNAQLVTRVRARSGFGISHSGVNFDLADFLTPSINGGPFDITVQEQIELTAFSRQFDEGIAPAAHRAYLMNVANLATAAGQVRTILLAQADNAWVDVAAIGYENVGGSLVDLKWAYDPTTQLFTCHDGTLSPRNWTSFQAAITGAAQYLFVGLPPSNAKRFALDPDNDDLTDAQEAALAQPTDARNRDSDGDTYDDGYEVQVGSSPTTANTPVDSTPPTLRPGTALQLDHKLATFAKFYAEFNEPVTWQLEAIDVNANPPVVASVTRCLSFQREAMIHMHELIGSTDQPGGNARTYQPRLTITDPRGNSTVVVGANLETEPQLIVNNPDGLQILVEDIQLAGPVVRTSNSMQFGVDVNVRFKAEAANNVLIPAAGRIVIAHVLRRAAGEDSWTMSPMSEITSAQQKPWFFLHSVDPDGFDVYTAFTQLYEVVQLPVVNGFLISGQADANGDVSFDLTHANLNAGDEVRVSIVAVVIEDPNPPQPDTFELLSIFGWDLPRTQGGATPTVPNAKDNRGITVAF